MNAPLHGLYENRLRSSGCLVAREESNGYGARVDQTDWTVVHERIVALGKARAAHEHELCVWLLSAERLAVHTRTGHASLYEYVDRIVGLSRRQTEERLRVGRALPALPKLEAALGSGELPWSAVRELTRVANRDTEGAWRDWARGRPVRQIEAAVAVRKPGDRPLDRSDPTLAKHRLRFEVRAETMALFRDLQAAVRADLGGSVDDDTLLFEIARRALGGPHDEGRASYQVAVVRCPDCAAASIDAGGQSQVVGPEVAEMAACDSQLIPHVGAADSPRRATQTIPPAVRRLVRRRDHNRCVVPGCRNHRFLDVHHLDARCEGGGHHPERLAVLCGAHHRAVHAGSLVIEGSASVGFHFRHADGSLYGDAVDPARVDVVQQVLGALEHMGFKASQARARVDAVLACGAPPDVADFLRAALRSN